jgi:hypothetical protein
MMRKAVYAVVLLVIAMTGRADAQAPVAGGVLSGLTATTIADEGPITLSRAVFGAYVMRPLNDQLRIRAELLLMRKGVEWRGGVGGSARTSRAEFTYLDVPVVLEAGPNARPRVTPMLLAGVTSGWRLTCRFVASAVNALPSSDCPEGEMRRFDVAAVVGGGVRFPLLGRQARAEVRYSHGLRTLSPGAGVRHRAWTLVVGFDVFWLR